MRKSRPRRTEMTTMNTGWLPCTDMHGQWVLHNEMYIPGPDECMQCQCVNGRHNNCKSLLCAPPRSCQKYKNGERCCDFTCIDDHSPVTTYGDGGTDLGLRLVASAVTAVLSLALLLFLVYRLRQRRHRVPSPLRTEDTYTMTLMNYLRGSGYLGQNAPNYRGSHEFYYEEPPPPYSLWKGGDAAGEAPPPYSEAIAAPELRQSQRREPGGRVHAVLVMAGESERTGRATTLPARRRGDVVVRRPPAGVAAVLDDPAVPVTAPPEYTATCEPEPEPGGASCQSQRQAVGAVGGAAASWHRRGHQRSQSHDHHQHQRQQQQRHNSGGARACSSHHNTGGDLSRAEAGPGPARRHRRSGSDHRPSGTVSDRPPPPPPDHPLSATNCVDLSQYLSTLAAVESQPRDQSEYVSSDLCLETGEYLPSTRRGGQPGGAEAAYLTVQQRRRQCRAQAEQLLQRFSLQLALDCSDSCSSSSPAASPERAGAASVSSSSTDNCSG